MNKKSKIIVASCALAPITIFSIPFIITSCSKDEEPKIAKPNISSLITNYFENNQYEEMFKINSDPKSKLKTKMMNDILNIYEEKCPELIVDSSFINNLGWEQKTQITSSDWAQFEDKKFFIKKDAFTNLKKLTKVTLPDDVLFIDAEFVTKNTPYHLTKLPTSLLGIGQNNDFVNGTHSGIEYQIPKNLKVIEDRGFQTLTFNESIETLPDSLIYIGNNAFHGLTNNKNPLITLKQITFPENCVYLGDYLYSFDTTKLRVKTITMPNNLKYWSKKLFALVKVATTFDFRNVNVDNLKTNFPESTDDAPGVISFYEISNTVETEKSRDLTFKFPPEWRTRIEDKFSHNPVKFSYNVIVTYF